MWELCTAGHVNPRAGCRETGLLRAVRKLKPVSSAPLPKAAPSPSVGKVWRWRLASWVQPAQEVGDGLTARAHLLLLSCSLNSFHQATTWAPSNSKNLGDGRPFPKKPRAPARFLPRSAANFPRFSWLGCLQHANLLLYPFCAFPRAILNYSSAGHRSGSALKWSQGSGYAKLSNNRMPFAEVRIRHPPPSWRR